MASKRKPTWLDVAVTNAGMRRGTTGMVWAYQWAVVRESLGREPSVDEVAEWWAMNRRKAFRDQAAFREAFPMLDTPAQIYASPEVRASLRAHAEFGDKVEKVGEKRRQLTQELGALRIGRLTANL
jgi:hypothetical protein